MRTVLLVLQSEDFSQALQNLLKHRYQVISAKNAVEGADLLRRQPDFLLLDLFLPSTDGLTFLKQNQLHLPPSILLFTTVADPAILDAASKLGIQAVFLKPCSISAVQTWLDTPR